MTSPDSRLVQTAVIGSRDSGRAIILPTDAEELTRWRRRHPSHTYWCGTQLGGCGNELSDRLYRDKVCHFAHRPHTSCHRTATGTSSADHLFIKDDLTAWAGRQRFKGRATSRNLGTGPGDAVDFRVGEARQHVRFQFSRLPHTEWSEARARLSREASTLDWVFGPGTAQPETMEELYDEYGYLLRFRFETLGAARHIRLRAEDPRHATDWVPLDACAMTPDGLDVPGARPRRRSAGPRADARPGAVTDAARMPPRSRDEQVRALGEALVDAARFRTRPTWETLCRSAGDELLALPVPDRVDVLISVERAAGAQEGPLLSALLRNEAGEPPSYVGEVVAAAGCGLPATAAVLKRWCQREADRAFAVYGVPSRTAPRRLVLTDDGQIAGPRAEPLRQQTIVHVQRGAVPQRYAGLEEALRDARRLGAKRLTVALLDQLDDALASLPAAHRAPLLSEAKASRDWLNSEREQQQPKRSKKAAAKSGNAAALRKKVKGTLRNARPLPKPGGAAQKKAKGGRRK